MLGIASAVVRLYFSNYANNWKCNVQRDIEVTIYTSVHTIGSDSPDNRRLSKLKYDTFVTPAYCIEYEHLLIDLCYWSNQSNQGYLNSSRAVGISVKLIQSYG